MTTVYMHATSTVDIGMSRSTQEQAAGVRTCTCKSVKPRKIRNQSEFTSRTKNSNMYCAAVRRHEIVAKHVTGYSIFSTVQ